MRVCIDKVCEAVVDCCESLVASICGKGRGLIFPHDDECKSIRFEGIEDVYIYEGDDIDLTCGVHAYDADGNEVEYTVKPSEIPSGKSGVFDIKYTAVGADTILKPTVCGKNKLHASAYCADRKVTAHRKVLVRNKLCVSTLCNFVLDCGTDGYVPYDCE